MEQRVAGIDIGTNTVLMLVAEYQNEKLVKLKENFALARLGEDLDKTGVIKRESIDRTKIILAENLEICKSLGVDKIIAVGTSALRDAKNSENVIDELNGILGTTITVISGLEEAKLSFLGTVNSDKTSLVIDIGGGSTELIIGKSNNIIERISLQMGAVRMSERFFNRSHPPNYEDIIKAENCLIQLLNEQKVNNSFEKVYAVAGTATTLATTVLGLADYEVEKICGYILLNQDISRVYDLYLSSSVDTIINKLLVHPGRADLILAGSLILKNIAKYYSITEVVVSSHGLRYGILNNYFNNQFKK